MWMIRYHTYTTYTYICVYRLYFCYQITKFTFVLAAFGGRCEAECGRQPQRTQSAGWVSCSRKRDTCHKTKTTHIIITIACGNRILLLHYTNIPSELVNCNDVLSGSTLSYLHFISQSRI